MRARANNQPQRTPIRRSKGTIAHHPEEIAIRLQIEKLPEGVYVARSPDVPGLVAEGRSIVEAAEIAQGLARKIIESCLEHGDPLPPTLAKAGREPIRLVVPVSVH